jgi:glycosyltransferase involved in cell wall biosynthesis
VGNVANPTGVSEQGTLRRLSVVITNFNYATFVGRSIDSALAIDWEDLEVVVIDDGSTDNSLEVIASYRERVRLIESTNQGQREAANLGFRNATGDVVIFLDSDDVLPREIARAINDVIRPGVSKIQFQMQRIDGDDVAIGSPFPHFRSVPTPALIHHWMLETTAYPTPPGSANAYSREFLNAVMPLGEEIGGFADSGLLAAAPLLGDVVVTVGVIVGYRRHGSNDSDFGRSVDTFYREADRALRRWNYARKVANLEPQPERVFRSREVLQFRVAAARRTPERRLPGDNRWRMCLDTFSCLMTPGPESLVKRIAISSWALAILLIPSFAVEFLIAVRFGQPSRLRARVVRRRPA